MSLAQRCFVAYCCAMKRRFETISRPSRTSRDSASSAPCTGVSVPKTHNFYRCAITALPLFGAVLSGCSGLNAGSSGFDPYVGLSAGASQLEVDIEGDGIGLADSNDTAATVTLGGKFTNRLGGELQFSDLGSATLDSGDDIGYQTASALVVGRLFPRRTGANLYAKAGFGVLDNDAPSSDTIVLETNNTLNFVTGVGAEYQFNSGLGFRFELVGHDQDAQFAALGVTYSFGNSKRQRRQRPLIVGQNETNSNSGSSGSNNPIIIARDEPATDGDDIASADIIVRDRPVVPTQPDIEPLTTGETSPVEAPQLEAPPVEAPQLELPQVEVPSVVVPSAEVPTLTDDNDSDAGGFATTAETTPEPVAPTVVTPEPVAPVVVAPDPVAPTVITPAVTPEPVTPEPVTPVIPRSTADTIDLDDVATPEPIPQDPLTPGDTDPEITDLATNDSDALVTEDLDKDGVDDSRDECLSTSNGIPVDSGGCDRYSGLFTDIKFDTGSIFLSPASQEVLDEVVLDLENFPRLNLELQLQATSTEAADTFLARRRTIEILRYFRARGVAGNRVKTQGPITQPVTGVLEGVVFLRTIR